MWSQPSAGYWDTETVQQAIRTGAQVLVSPDGAAAWNTGQPRQMANNPVAQHIRAELATEAGRALYRMRQAIVEPVIGYIKSVRGFRRFKLRRLSRVCAGWQIICMTHNLLKLFPAPSSSDRLREKQRAPACSEMAKGLQPRLLRPF